SIMVVLSLSTLGITVAFTIYYSTRSIPYVLKYTKLTLNKYVESLLVSSMIVGLLFSAIMALLTMGVYSFRFDYVLMPKDFELLLGIGALSSVFMTTLATLLMTTMINYLGTKNVQYISFIPLILSYLFGFSQIFGQLPSLVLYVSPFNDIISLFYTSYSGSSPLISYQSVSNQSSTLNPVISLLSLIGWSLLLCVVDLLLLKRLKSTSLEEGRMV
ncbi:hypothetical protein, partial [Acidianus sp. RZ1]